MDRQKRFAANTIVYGDVKISPGVVEIAHAEVTGYSFLNAERANTIWLGGDIVLEKNADGALQAFHNGVLLE